MMIIKKNFIDYVHQILQKAGLTKFQLYEHG